MFHRGLCGLIFSASLGVASLLANFTTPSRAQDSLRTPQIPVAVPKGYRLLVRADFHCDLENLLVISRQTDGHVERAFNSIFGSRWDFEAPAGGGTWTSPGATETTVFYLTGQHKDTGREGGGGRPWRLSRFKAFVAGELDGVIGFEDGGGGDGGADFNDLTVHYWLEKVGSPSN
jgi:hypothetical protein